MRTRLNAAIEEQRLVHLLYDGKSRNVEPYLVGKNDRDEDVFLGRQVFPWVPMDKSWQVFQLTKIYGLLILDVRFERPLDLSNLPAHVLSGIRLMV